MNLIILKQTNFPEIPEKIKLMENFGHESICNDKGEVLAVGEVILVSGEKEDMVDWLKGIDGFWKTDNPMCGEWEVVHIKNNQERFLK